MREASDCRLLSLPASVLDGMPQPAVRDAVSYFDPELVVLPGARDAGAYAAVRDAAANIPVIHPQLGRASQRVTHVRYLHGHGVRDVSYVEAESASEMVLETELSSGTGGVKKSETETGETETGRVASTGSIDVIAVQDGTVLTDLATDLRAGRRRTDERAATYLVVPALSVEWETTTLSSMLPHAEEIASIASSLPEPVVVLAGGQPAAYRHAWTLPGDDSEVEVPIAGLGACDREEPTIAMPTCTQRGPTGAETVPADRFGLRALNGVGSSTARRLHALGCRSRDEVVDVGVDELSELPGVGRMTASRIHAHAEVIASGEPLVCTNKTPVKTRNGRPPICLDVETDGLSPTIIWQFGVYDPADDSYRSFVERRTPNEPAGVLGAFVEWFLANHGDRTVLTWNGYRFDYLHIKRFLRRYQPQYVDAWNDVWTYDLYKWAVLDGNALLPGRTNTLSHVARSLGFEGASTGLSGSQTAAAYQAFMRNPDDPEAVPDWDRHEAYCEGDCRALWYVYEAIQHAGRRDVTDSGDGGAAGRQAGLTDFKT